MEDSVFETELMVSRSGLGDCELPLQLLRTHGGMEGDLAGELGREKLGILKLIYDIIK